MPGKMMWAGDRRSRRDEEKSQEWFKANEGLLNSRADEYVRALGLHKADVLAWDYQKSLEPGIRYQMEVEIRDALRPILEEKIEKEIRDELETRLREKIKREELVLLEENCKKKESNKRRDMRRYKMTAQEYDNLASSCEVCGSVKNLAIDHDHLTGKVRGRLCITCNTTLGKMKDDTVNIKTLASYLERNE